VAQIHLSFDL
jgi:hypothetical protein